MRFSYSFKVHSPLCRTEVASRVSRLLEPQHSILRARFDAFTAEMDRTWGRPRHFSGVVSSTGFALTASAGPRPAILPLVSGVFRGSASGTDIEVTVAPERVWLFIQALLSLLFLGLAGYLGPQTLSLPGFRFLVPFFLVLALLPWPLTASLAQATARHLQLRLESLLEVPNGPA